MADMSTSSAKLKMPSNVCVFSCRNQDWLMQQHLPSNGQVSTDEGLGHSEKAMSICMFYIEVILCLGLHRGLGGGACSLNVHKCQFHLGNSLVLSHIHFPKGFCLFEHTFFPSSFCMCGWEKAETPRYSQSGLIHGANQTSTDKSFLPCLPPAKELN